jgi:hypothetical protein
MIGRHLGAVMKLAYLPVSHQGEKQLCSLTSASFGAWLTTSWRRTSAGISSMAKGMLYWT